MLKKALDYSLFGSCKHKQRVDLPHQIICFDVHYNDQKRYIQLSKNTSHNRNSGKGETEGKEMQHNLEDKTSFPILRRLKLFYLSSKLSCFDIT